MAFQIEDGTGRGFVASVSESNRFNVSSKSNPRIFYASRDDKRAFTLTSVDTSADAGDLIFYMLNTSTTRNIFIKEVHVGAANAAAFKIWVVTGTAAGGSALTATNLNLASGITAELTARGDGAITGLTTGALIDMHRTQAFDHGVIQHNSSLILGPNDAIAVEYDAGTTGAADVSVEFHYEDVDRRN